MLKSFKNKDNVNSLSFQLILRLGILLIALTAVIILIQSFLLKDSLYSSSKSLLESRQHNLEADEITGIKTMEDLKEKADDFIYKMIDSNVSILIIDKNGNILADSETLRKDIYSEHFHKKENDIKASVINTPKFSKTFYQKVTASTGNSKGYLITENSRDEKFMVKFLKIGSPDNNTGLIQLSTSLDPLSEILFKSILIFILFSVFVLALSWFIINNIINRTLKPLNNVTDNIEKINAEKLHLRIPEDTKQSEINRLSKAFNGMLERIELSFKKENEINDKMKKFVSDASHELKTPITSIHGFAEVLSMGAAKDEKQLQTSLEAIMNESDRLTRLINSLLLLSRFDQNYQLEMKTENLSEITKEIQPQLTVIAQKRKLELNIENDIFIKANKDQIKQIVFNLVQNAVRYSPEETGIIKISLSSIAKENIKYAELTVEDNGIGIPEENISSIFDRFYRVNSHRARSQGGYGLGLSIVKSIVEAHRGEILVWSKLGKGTTFKILFKIEE
ncbi:MAG: HAMP domain-containing protein [Bacillota bacterium]|nr:HAMP domain-containing protein [Bacillota bacterium]